MTADSSGLGTKPVARLALTMSVPTIVAQAANASYTIIDRLFIGHIPEVGDAAMTGVGICFPILLAVTAFASLIGAGGAPRASIELGRGNFKKAERILGTSAAFLVAIALTLTVILQATKEPVLRAFGASDANIGYAVDFITIYLVGTVFVQLTLGLNNFISAQGKTTVAMTSVLIGTGTSIILDPVFIFVLGWGVKGAAVATILSQAVSAVWVFSFLNGKQTKLRIRKEYLKVQPQIILPVMGLGLASFVMNITESLINIAFNASLSKYGGDVAVGAMTILASIMQLQFMPVQGLGQGAQPLISYNYGAAKVDRVKKTIRILIVVSLIYTMAFWLFVECFPGVFVQLFNSSSPELYEMTTWAARIYMGMTGIFGIQMAIQQTFMSLGQAKLSLFIACLRKIILLLPLIYLMPMFIENKVFAVFLAEPVSDFISVAVASTLFLCNIKKILAKA